MKGLLKNGLKALFFFGIGFGILYLVFNKFDEAYKAQCELDGIPLSECSLVNKILQDFTEVNYFWIVVVILAFLLSNISRGIRWNMLIEPLGYKPGLANAFWSLMLGYFANLGLPRMGEIIRGGTMSKYEDIPVEKLMGTIVVDRIVDVISLLIVIGLSFLLAYNQVWTYLDENMKLPLSLDELMTKWWFWVFAGGMILGLLSLYIFRKQLQNSALYTKVMNIVKGFWEGLTTIKNLKRPGLFLLHSVIIWVLYFLMTYLCFWAYEPTMHLSMVAGLVVFVFGSIGIVIPSPGGMGTYHALVSAALVIYGVEGDNAFSFAMIMFVAVQFICNISFGLLSLVILPLINKSK